MRVTKKAVAERQRIAYAENMVTDFIRKGLLAGIGAAVITKESAEKVLHDLVEKGKVTQQEASEMAQKLVDDGQEEYTKARSELNKTFESFLQSANLVTRSEYDVLVARVAALEAQLAQAKTVTPEPQA